MGGRRSTPTLRVGLPPHGSIPKSTFLADLGKERVDEQVCPSTLIPVCLLARPPRQFRNPPSGRDCCASSVAAPLPCPLGSAEMEGFHPSKPPHERGFAPLSKPAGQRFVICHLSHYFSDVVAKNNGLPNFEGLSLPTRLRRDGGVSPLQTTPKTSPTVTNDQ